MANSDSGNSHDPSPRIESISAVTLTTCDVAASIRFYRSLGFDMLYGGPSEAMTSFQVGQGFLNLQKTTQPDTRAEWGRIVLYVSDVDAMFDRCVASGWQPTTTPTDAPWGERFFHITDPAGHELSFAKKIE